MQFLSPSGATCCRRCRTPLYSDPKRQPQQLRTEVKVPGRALQQYGAPCRLQAAGAARHGRGVFKHAALVLRPGLRQACAAAAAVFQRRCHLGGHVWRRAVGRAPAHSSGARPDSAETYDYSAAAVAALTLHQQSGNWRICNICPCSNVGCRRRFGFGMCW